MQAERYSVGTVVCFVGPPGVGKTSLGRSIARTYLLPRQLEKAGLPTDAIQLLDATLRQVIDDYTREAGVRRLEQQLGSLTDTAMTGEIDLSGD